MNPTTQIPVADTAQAFPISRKKHYAQPTVMRVPLRPDEAVLGNCKLGAASGPSGECATPIPCVTLAS
ncbi:MAG: hypothetical protein N3D11_15750 [Candidatus Sumerlaeia bacterium]|nr:hypothetical protein [Candidatus Sumerlaeia bacterium]